MESTEASALLEENYYNYFNIPVNATPEEIKGAYRRLSKMFHPDKHTDPVRKQYAEELFNKTKKIYEVLIDPHKRAIYDTLGVKGLETEGWETVQWTKSPQEIREEYERLTKERERQQLQQRTNPKGTITVGINATDLFEAYDTLDTSYPQLEINSMSVSQSVEAPVSHSNTVTLRGNLSTQNGTGSGTFACSLRHVLSPQTWAEFETAAGSGLFLTLKVFKTFSRHCFSTVVGLFHFTPIGVRPGVEAMLARHLDGHTVSYLTLKGGHQSSMNVSVVRDTTKHHLVSSLQLGISNTFIMMSYSHKFEEDGRIKGSVKVGVLGTVVEYGCEKRISKHSILGASMSLGVPSGVVLKVKLTRGNQNFMFPVLLSEEIIPSAVFYGTLIPLVSWYAVKILVIKPYQEQQRKREAQKLKEANAEEIAKRRQEAAAAVALLQETYSRIKETEEAKGGLVITRALYGKLGTPSGQENANPNDLVDVTVPLQCMVQDSKLILSQAPKSTLSGFYDPCLGEEKHLMVSYKFRNLPHKVTVADSDMLRIPKESHLVRN